MDMATGRALAVATVLAVMAFGGSAARAQQPAAPVAAGPGLTFFPSASGRSPFSEAVQAGDFLFASGQIGLPPKDHPDDFEAASRHAMDAIAKVLGKHESSLDQVVQCTVMLADMKQWPAFNAVYVTYFKPDRLPARSAFGANGLANGAPLEVSCFAYAPRR